jgi:hypothetical protein
MLEMPSLPLAGRQARTRGVDLIALTVVVAAALLLATFINLRLAHNGGDIGIFVVAGTKFVDQGQLPVHVPVVTSDGYDGQFFFRLALDPFTSSDTANGIRLDNPPWRQQRIVYPLIVWLLSLGHPALVPWLLVLVNYSGLCVLALLGAFYSRAVGQAAGWGLVFPLYPGFLISLSRDLAEIVELCFVVAALLAARRRRPLLTAVALSLAVLTRESAVLVLVGLAVDHVVDRQRGRVPRLPIPALVAPALVLAIWQAVLVMRWGQLPALTGSGDPGAGDIGPPFAGVAAFGISLARLDTSDQVRWLLELVFLAVFVVAVLLSVRSSTAARPEGVAWLAYLGLASLFTTMVWVEDIAFMRILSELYVLGAMVLIGSRASARICIFANGVVVWVLLAARLVQQI